MNSLSEEEGSKHNINIYVGMRKELKVIYASFLWLFCGRPAEKSEQASNASPGDAEWGS